MSNKEKLLRLLNTLKVNHKTEILNQETLKNAHIYCKINEIPNQLSGHLIESFLEEKYKMVKNKASDCIGDLKMDGKNVEVKISLGGLNCNKFNYVQLRINHKIDYYFLTAYYVCLENINECGELFIFKIDNVNIKQLILKYGGYAHGTSKNLGKITSEDLNNVNNEKEYALRPKYNSKLWNEMLRFRIRI